MQSEFCTRQNASENKYIVYQPRRRPNIVQSLVSLRWGTSLQ